MTVRQRALARGFTLLCFLALFAQLVTAIPHLSATYDEPIYIGIGYADLTVGDFYWHGVIGHGPMINLLSALPLLVRPDSIDVTQMTDWGGNSSLGFGRDVLKALGPLEQTLFVTRLPITWLTVILAAVVFRWARQVWGKTTGLLALAIFAFEPGLIAHGQLNTTDMGVTTFGFIGTYLLSRYLRKVTPATYVGAGLALGATIASKASGLFMVGAYGLVIFIYWLTSNRQGSERTIRSLLMWGVRLAGMLSLALVTLWACYGFEFGPLVPDGIPLPAPSHWRGMIYVQSYLVEGQNTFIAGTLYQGGHWSYFPLAFILKTPLPLAAGLLFSVYVTLRRGAGPRWHTVSLLIPPIAYFAISMLAGLNIGHRHLLPAMPFAIIWIAQSLSATHLPTLAGSAWRKAVTVGLVAWYVIGTLSIFPNYLTYFNELAGGPEGGYRYLADSSIDWGQGFYELADYLAQRQRNENNSLPPVLLAAFSSVDPAWYGIDFTPLPPTEHAPVGLSSRFQPDPGVYIISVVPLQGIWMLDPDTYDWFRHQEPRTRIAHVLNVYEVKATDRMIERLVQCAAPTPPLDTTALAKGFGQSIDNDTVFSNFDCRDSWLYPGEGGWLILPGTTPQGEWIQHRLADVPITFSQRDHWSHPAGALYELSALPSGAQPPQTAIHVGSSTRLPPQILKGTPLIDGPIGTSGPLTFLGYETEIGPAETTLDTFWRVDTLTDRPPSLMAHLLNAEGLVVAVADGLGTSIENWQPGDIIVQRHNFQIPDTQGEPYYLQTGAYWLDTIERWAVSGEDGNSADTILIPEIVR